MDKHTTLQVAPRKRSAVRRVVRFGFWSIAIIMLVSLALLWMATRSWFIISRITPELERRLGGNVLIGSAAFDWNGRFVIEDVVVRSPQHAGTAGEIASIGQVVLSVEIRELLAGRVNLLSVDMHDLLLRMSEDADQRNEFSFGALDADWTDADPGRTRPPRIQIHNATLEYGTYSGSEYTMHGQRHVAGIMHPAADDADGHWYNFLLGEINESGGAREQGLTIRGRWNAATHQYLARMDGLELNASTYDMCPQVVRTWWDQMELEGRVAHAIVQWDAASGLDVTSEILDVGLRLPIQPGQWSRYHDGRIIGDSGRPEMRVNSGTIHLRDNELLLDTMVGELKGPGDAAGVPYTVTMRLPQLPAMNWPQSGGRDAFVADVREYTPFDVRFELTDFRIVPDEHGKVNAVDLPQPVAEMLQRFAFTEWTLSTSIQISRKPAVTDAAGERQPQPVEIAGDLAIHDASGSFYKFPYPLSGVEAYLTFTQAGVQVHHVTGTSPNGASMHIAGEIAPLGRDPRIDLRLTAKNAPIDELMRDALPQVHATLFDGMMHEPSQQALRRQGLLIDDACLEQLQREREELLAALEAEPHDEALRQRFNRTQDRIEAGVFELGGTVDLDVMIQRELGPDMPTELSGEIAIHRVDAVIEHFPYPFSIRGGTVQWGPQGATLIGERGQPGLPVITQTGGRGFISGDFQRIEREGERDLIIPNVHIEVEDDVVSELLYAAIPDKKDAPPEEALEGLSPSAQLLKAVGLAGPMRYSGSIIRDAQGELAYEFDVHLVNGAASPAEDLSNMLGSAGLVWPTNWTWDDVNVHVRVSRQTVELVEFAGRRDEGAVSATGVLDVRSPGADASLDVRMTDVALGRYLLDLFPPDRAARASELWDDLMPRGAFNAHLQFHKRGDRIHPPRLFLEPAEVTINLADQPMKLTHRNGRILVHERAVQFDQLQLDLQRGDDTSDGQIMLDGSLGFNQGSRTMQLRGTWQDGRLESPMVGELLGLFNAEEHWLQLRKAQATGEFDAVFDYDTEAEDSDAYQVQLQPRSLAANLRGQRFDAQLDEPSSVILRPGRIELLDIRGAHDSGRFELAGEVKLDQGVNAVLDFDYAGALSSAFAQALLPPALQRALEEVEFEDGTSTRIADARLRLAQPARGGLTSPEPWHVQFDGTVHTDRATLGAGIDVKDIDGEFAVSLNVDPGQVPKVAIDATIHHLRVFGRNLTNVVAPGITLSEDGQTLLVREVRGDVYGGAMWAEAFIGVGENPAYEVDAEFVGVSLQQILGESSDAQTVSRRSRGPRGSLYGSVKFSGMRGQPASRTGRGSARAIGSGLANVPLVLQLMQLMQLTVPLRGDMDHADVIFYIDGERAVFERILLESTVGSAAALQLIGSGELNLSTFELDTQFRSRSGMLLIRDLVGGLSDQLYIIEVTGTLDRPRAQVVPLPGLQPDRVRLNSSAAVLSDPTR